MKTLEYLYRMKKANDEMGNYEATNLYECIAELKSIQSRSCEGCKCWDSVEFSIIKTLSYCRFLNTGTKNTFYCSEFEAKEEIK